MPSVRSLSAHVEQLAEALVDVRLLRLHLAREHLQDLARLGGHLADLHLAGQAVERHPVAFLQRLALHGERLVLLVDDERARTDDRRLAHLAADDGGVRGHAAGRGENALRHFHPVDVVGHGLLPHEQHLLALLRPLHRVVRGEHHLARRRTRRRRQALGQRPAASSTPSGSNTGDSSCDSEIGSTSSSASRGVTSRSAARSVAMTTAA